MTNSDADASHRHVAVLTFPFASHPGLILRLLRRIAAAEPGVTFSFYGTAKSNKPIFADPVPDNIKPFDVHDGMPEGFSAGNHQEEIAMFLKVAAESFKGAMEKAVAEIGRPISCLVADAFLWFTADMAEEKGIPWVALWTSGACSLFTHFHTDLIRETVGINGIAGRENESLSFVPGLPAIRLGDLQGGIVSGNLESPFAVMLHKMSHVLPKAAAVQINSFEELEPEINKHLKLNLKNVLNICPNNLISISPPLSSYSDDYQCITWLDKQKTASVAYIGFGTFIAPPPHELVALAEALEESGTPFLWSLKDSALTFLPPGFVERTGEKGKIVSWAPQVQVLGHPSVGVYFTHCGWNSVLESIVAGVPIVSRPFLGDQQINTWMVESSWEIGVRLEGGVFTKSGTIDALQQVLSGEKGKKLKEKMAYYKELALKAVEPEGSSAENFNALVEIVAGHGKH